MLNLVNELGVNLAGAEIILRMREQIEILQDKLNDAKNEITKLKE